MAEPTKSPMQLQDVINYVPDQYFSDAEMDTIRNAFRGTSGKTLLKILRKALIPTISDPELPLEQFKNDFFLSGREYSTIGDNDLKSIVLGRQEALKFICGALIQLQVIANSAPPNAADKEKDSSK